MEDNAPLRVLQVLNHMDYGGIEAVVMNYYRYIDRSRVQFDFAVSEESSLPQKEEIKKLGGTIYLLPKVSHILSYIGALKKIVKDNGYKIVHCHMNTLSVFPLYASYLAGAGVRICHNHTTAHHGEGKRAAAKYVLRLFCKWFATDYFACGEYAGRWMYGNQCFDAGKVYVMRNAIDVEKFRFNSEVRACVRKQLGLADKFVVGHIGRFMYQKNQNFLVDIFYEVYQKNRNAVLLLVGDGELEGQIREKVKQRELEDAVIFYGNCRDTSRLYQAMDVFCLPSFYEGVPVVAIEAQANGLPVLISDRVSGEAKITGSCEMIPLEMTPGVWAGRMLENNWEKRSYRQEDGLLAETGFSIKQEIKKLEESYLDFL